MYSVLNEVFAERSTNLDLCSEAADTSFVGNQDENELGDDEARKYEAAVVQWLRASNIFRQLCQSTSEWRGFESRWFCRSGFEFTNTQLSILNH